jgi:hypothetical protein
MTSNGRKPPPLPDLVFTQEDVEAMRRSAEASRRMPASLYLEFLTVESQNVPPRRDTSEGWEPFTLFPDPDPE